MAEQKYEPSLRKFYKEQIIPQLMKEFNYTSVMQCPKIEKIVLNQGLGEATQDKKVIEIAKKEMALITGQQPIETKSRKDIAGFKLRKDTPIGVKVTLRHERMQIDGNDTIYENEGKVEFSKNIIDIPINNKIRIKFNPFTCNLIYFF